MGTMVKLKMLIIDDHTEFRRMLRSFIERQKLDVDILESASGEEGVETAVKERPQIALIDIRLPRMDGMEAAEQIKEQVPECRIITMSMFEKKGGQQFVTQDVVAFMEKDQFDSTLPPLLHRLVKETGV